VNKYIGAAAVRLNKRESLCRVEPLHNTVRHLSPIVIVCRCMRYSRRKSRRAPDGCATRVLLCRTHSFVRRSLPAALIRDRRDAFQNRFQCACVAHDVASWAKLRLRPGDSLFRRPASEPDHPHSQPSFFGSCDTGRLPLGNGGFRLLCFGFLRFAAASLLSFSHGRVTS
jgi:hypothetical protein